MENAQQTIDLKNLIKEYSKIRIFLFEKQKGRGEKYKVYLFPNDVTDETLDDYKSNFEFFVSGREVVDYCQTETKKETIQKLSCNELPQWEIFKNLIDNFPVVNAPIFAATNVSDKIKMTVVECTKEDGSAPVYLISKFSHKKVYGRKIRFSLVGGTFKKLNHAVLTLGDCIDCFIYGGNVYILLESRFDSLFDFHKKINDEVNVNLGEISDWNFFDNNDISENIVGKPRKGRQFLKVINSENLTTWKSKNPQERKAIILGNPLLKDKFEFDKNDRIIFSKEALNELFKLLTDDYFKSIITGETCER